MGVEQEAAGCRIVKRRFYQIGLLSISPDAQCAQPRQTRNAGERFALSGGLVAVELQQGERDIADHFAHPVGRGVHEQAHHRNERRHVPDQFQRLCDAHRARARRIKHEADRVRTEVDGVGNVRRSGKSAQLDARPTGYGSVCGTLLLLRLSGGRLVLV